MLFKELGSTGVLIPEVGIGTWSYHAGPGPIRKGLNVGARFIDTAESYGSEPVVAKAIAGQRDCVFLATKVSRDHFRRADVLKAADNSLRNLGADHIDLYQLHEPNAAIPVDETLGAMEELVDAGKVRFIGVSNFSLPQLQAAQRALRKHRIVSNQVRFNLTDRTINGQLLPYCQANRITIIAYSPLAREFQRVLECDPRGVLAGMAGATGRTPAQIALNWCLCRDGVVVIPKSNSASHLVENCGASDWRLDAEQVQQLDDAILSRRRGSFETFFRRFLPPTIKKHIQRLVKLSPRALRHRID